MILHCDREGFGMAPISERESRVDFVKRYVPAKPE